MLSLKIKDLKNRNFFFKNEKKNIANHFLFTHLLNRYQNKKKRLLFLYFLLRKKHHTKINNQMKTKIVRRCSITNRGRATFRPYGVSRFILRNFMQFGVLPGFKKAVW